VPEKHDMRLQFHAQLADLWATHPSLRDNFKLWQDKGDSAVDRGAISNPAAGPATSASPMVPFQAHYVGTHRLLSLITDFASMICELEILFLRKEDKGHLVNQAGDLDNRIKVLFDALRAPRNENEIPNNAIVPDPFFCLLEDDRLITRVNVAS
jgi:hypothetical protein